MEKQGGCPVIFFSYDISALLQYIAIMKIGSFWEKQ